jgi:hypothetical protein
VFVVVMVVGDVAGGPFMFARERLVLVNMGDTALLCLHARGRLCNVAAHSGLDERGGDSCIGMEEVGSLALGCERVVVACDVVFCVWRWLVVVAGDMAFCVWRRKGGG